MENLIKGILISFVSLIVVLFLSILILPWMWNWGVFIYQSPHSAGVATNIYLTETIEIVLPFIIGGLAGLVLIRYTIDEFRSSHEVNEYYIEARSTPTLQETLSNIPSEPQKMADSTGVGETIIVTEHTDNGGLFHHTTRGSELYRQIISKNAARQTKEYNDRINQKSDDLLKGHYERINRSI